MEQHLYDRVVDTITKAAGLPHSSAHGRSACAATHPQNTHHLRPAPDSRCITPGSADRPTQADKLAHRRVQTEDNTPHATPCGSSTVLSVTLPHKERDGGVLSRHAVTAHGWIGSTHTTKPHT